MMISFSCGKKSENMRMLEKAEELMNNYPDSAYEILKTVDPKVLSHKQYAFWAYLYSKAEYKLYLENPDENLLDFISYYYKNGTDSLTYQSFLFKGTVFHEKGLNDSALIYLNKSLDLSSAARDYYYEGLAARELGSLYGDLLMTAKEIEYAQRAKSRFLQAGKSEHAAWMDLGIANALERNGQEIEALNKLDSIDGAPLEDRAFNQELIRIKINSLNGLKKHEEVIEQYKILEGQEADLTPFDLMVLIENNINIDNFKEAQKYFELLKNSEMTPNDSLYLKKIKSMLFLNDKNYKAAYDEISDLSNRIMLLEEKRLKNPPTNLLIDNYKLQNELYKAKDANNRFLTWLIVSISLLIIVSFILFIFYQRTKFRDKEQELEIVLNESENLKNHIWDLSRKNKVLTGEKSRNEILEKELTNLFSQHFILLDRLCDICYHNIESEGKRISKEIAGTIKNLEKIDVSNQLEDLINRYNNDWMKNFKDDFPKLKEWEYLLVMYTFLGFSRESTVILMGKKNVHNISVAKSRLKNKLISMNPSSPFIIRLFKSENKE